MRGCSSLIITAAPATCPLADEDSPNGAVVAVAATAEKSVERVCGAAAAATRAQRNEKKQQQQQHFITKECINTPMVEIDGSRPCYLQFPLLPTTSTAQLTDFTCKQTVKTIKIPLKLGQNSV